MSRGWDYSDVQPQDADKIDALAAKGGAVTNGVSADDIRDGLEIFIPTSAKEMHVSIDATLQGSSVAIFPHGSVERRRRRSFWRGFWSAISLGWALGMAFVGLMLWLGRVLR